MKHFYRGLGIALTFLIVPVIMRWIAKKWPAKESEYSSIGKPVKLTFGDWVVMIIFLGGLFLLSVPFGNLFSNLQKSLLSYLKPEAVYIVPVSCVFFWFPGFFISALVWTALLERLVKYDKNHLLSKFSPNLLSEKAANPWGIDSEKIHRPVYITFLIIAAILILMGFGWYTVISNRGLIIKNPLRLTEKLYSYGSIGKILHITDYKSKSSKPYKYYAVKMQDGKTWRTSWLEIHYTSKEKEIIDYISQQTRLPVQEGIWGVDDKYF